MITRRRIVRALGPLEYAVKICDTNGITEGFSDTFGIKTNLAKHLLSEDVGELRDPARAARLLEEALQQNPNADLRCMSRLFFIQLQMVVLCRTDREQHSDTLWLGRGPPMDAFEFCRQLGSSSKKAKAMLKSSKRSFERAV